MAARFTVAECDAEITRLKTLYDKLTEVSSVTIGSRQWTDRDMPEILKQIEWWQGQRGRARSGGIRNRNAVPA